MKTRDPSRPKSAQPGSAAGYSGAPLWRKLGYKTGTEAYVHCAPEGYASLLALPADVTVAWLGRPRRAMRFAHLFETRSAALGRRLRALRHTMAPDAVVWASWPKRSSKVATDLTEDVVRSLALPLGLVDVKVCAVDAVWSGLKLMIRKEER